MMSMMVMLMAALVAAADAMPSGNERRAAVAFPESRLTTAAQGTQINNWVGPLGVGLKWELCYTSFTMDKTPAEFHKRCDKYNITMTLAHTAFPQVPQGTYFGVCSDRYNRDTCTVIGSDCPPNDYKCTGVCSKDTLGMQSCSDLTSPCGNTGNFTFGGYVRSTFHSRPCLTVTLTLTSLGNL